MNERILSYFEKNEEDVKAFIKELVDKISREFKEYISFIILYGSAARGEFVKGVSDIDMVIQLNEKANSNIKKEVIRRSYDIFWELNKKYKMGFEKNIQTNLIEKVTPLYVPLFVFLPDEVDWKKGKFKKYYGLILNFFTSEKSVFFSFKYEGIVLYGKDIRKEIDVKWSRYDKFKQLFLPFWLINGSFLLAPFQLNKSKEYLIKAVSYAVLNQIHLLEKYDAITFKEKAGVFANHIRTYLPRYEDVTDDLNSVILYKHSPEKANYMQLLKKAYKLVLAYVVSNILYWRDILIKGVRGNLNSSK